MLILLFAQKNYQVPIFLDIVNFYFQWAFERDLDHGCDWTWDQFAQLNFYPEYTDLDFSNATPIGKLFYSDNF